MGKQTDPSDLISGISTAARVVGGVAGFAFAGIGLTVLVFLSSSAWDAWNSPPLFFRIFGSFIAVVFVAVGGTLGVAAVVGSGRLVKSPPRANAASSGNTGYRCPSCGAVLAEGADVSPLGDVRCPFCNNWFNVHGRG